MKGFKITAMFGDGGVLLMTILCQFVKKKKHQKIRYHHIELEKQTSTELVKSILEKVFI